MTCSYVTNYDPGWISIINKLSKLPGKEIILNRNVLTGTEYETLFNMWDSAKYNKDSIKWTNYYATDYGFTIEKYFESMLAVTHIRSWISRIDPGYNAAWHYDIDSNEEEYLKLGKLRRFVCFIGEPAVGHISIVENECFYNQVNGSVYEWNNYRAWHAGANVGLIPKYQYNFLAYS
jgi:hypothetical protein